ncbi:MAG: YceI family protein [Ferruginibacter sp.]
MKQILILSTAILLLASCNNNKSDKTETTEKQEILNAEGQQYSIDSSSIVTWTGSKPTGKHTGTFHVKEGNITVNNNNISAGNFTIDVTSLTNNDLAADPENKGKLEGHLKSPDFFDIAKYPTARFEITSVEPYTSDGTNKSPGNFTHLIKGNLSLKDSTKNISVPAKVTVDANSLTASADFNIDRTTWGMNYKGPNNPQDWFISKMVNVKLDIKATKK